MTEVMLYAKKETPGTAALSRKDPTLDDINAVLSEMDGRELLEISLEVGEQTFVVRGGKTEFAAELMAAGESLVLCNPIGSKETYRQIDASDEEGVPEQAIRFFFEQQQADPLLTWKEPQDAF